MIETKVDRIHRLEAATECIVRHPPSGSFSDLISSGGSSFKNFRLIYATENFETNFGGISLAEIEKRCPPISRYFAASGLLFYSDDLYRETIAAGRVGIPLSYSVSFDTQVAEAFRCYESGKNISDWDWFYTLVSFVKEQEFNFDYTFYILEDLVNSLDLSNQRPFNTIRSLKMFDHIDFNAFQKNPKKPVFDEPREFAGKRAANALYAYQSSEDVKRSLARRNGMLLILMKAACLRWQSEDDLLSKLSKLIEYSLIHLGKFAKLEIYFGWKLLKYGRDLRFFSPLMQPSEKALLKINGMSWDLYSIRHQETMASNSKYGQFHVPFIATFDRRFKELIEACPIRCMLIDDRDGRINTIFFDELEFFQDVSASTNLSLYSQLRSPHEKIGRFEKVILEDELNASLSIMKEEFRELVANVR